MAPRFAPVAQLDRVPGYEPGGRGFNSCRARQIPRGCASRPLFLGITTLIPMPDNPKRPHKLEDHLHGLDYDHNHDGDETADHDHDHYEADGRLEDNALWIQDHVSLLR